MTGKLLFAILVFAAILFVALFLTSCAGHSESGVLECSSSVEERPEGRRLMVDCSRDVENPPPECEPLGGGAYSCTTLHTYAEFCETFPGVCKQ